MSDPTLDVFIYDEYATRWRITNDEPLWAEASKATSKTKAKVVWPIAKLVEGRGWGWWSVYKRLDSFEKELENLVPHPGKQRLIDVNKTYTTVELRNMLQAFGSYLSTLHHMEGMIEGQCHALKEGFKTGLQVAVSEHESKNSTVSGKEGEVISKNDLLKQTRRMQIDQEACLAVVKGWRESYEQAWATVSRLITLELGEAELATGRHN